eukprot:10817943-Karenia_brevis.AAC.1
MSSKRSCWKESGPGITYKHGMGRVHNTFIRNSYALIFTFYTYTWNVEGYPQRARLPAMNGT